MCIQIELSNFDTEAFCYWLHLGGIHESQLSLRWLIFMVPLFYFSHLTNIGDNKITVIVKVLNVLTGLHLQRVLYSHKLLEWPLM